MTTTWAELAARLVSGLHLTSPPLAITFSSEPIVGVSHFDARAPEPLEDGRTGAVPAGCVFWIHAADSTFTTIAADHANCSVGSLTHGFLTLEEAATKSDVATMVEVGWVDMDTVPQIPVISERPGAVTYGRLADTPVDPDVVFMRVNAKQLMVLSDAIPGLRIEGKPQCHIIAVAKEHGQAAASVGCAASRARTGMPATEMTCALPADELADILEAIDRNAAADAAVAQYASDDARRFPETSSYLVADSK